MDVVFLIGRILFVLIFLNSGVRGHILGRAQTAQYAAAYGAPSPALTVPLSGAIMVIAGLMVLLGIWADLAALVLGVTVLVFAFFMHAFWKETDPQQQVNQMNHFMKNVAIAGGALIIFYAYNQLQDAAGASITDPLFGRAD